MVLCQYSIKFYYIFSYRCLCEHCQIMGSELECMSFKECGRTSVKLEENISLLRNPTQFKCITDHPRFQSVCLDPWVLQVAWLAYRQTYEDVYNGPQHKKYRHITYRQYVRWVQGHVGKNIVAVYLFTNITSKYTHTEKLKTTLQSTVMSIYR